MIMKDIVEMFISETKMFNNLELIAKVGLSFGLAERINGWCSGCSGTMSAYAQYNVWEYRKGGYVGEDVYGRVLGSNSKGMIAKCLCENGEYFLNELFAKVCLESGVRNPYASGGFINFVRSWLDDNELQWLNFNVMEG